MTHSRFSVFTIACFSVIIIFNSCKKEEVDIRRITFLGNQKNTLNKRLQSVGSSRNAKLSTSSYGQTCAGTITFDFSFTVNGYMQLDLFQQVYIQNVASIFNEMGGDHGQSGLHIVYTSTGGPGYSLSEMRSVFEQAFVRTRNVFWTHFNIEIGEEMGELWFSDDFHCQDNPPPSGGGGSDGGTPIPGTTPFDFNAWELSFYSKIDTSSLAPCFKKALKSAKALSNDMAGILKTFSASIPGSPGPDWVLINGSLPAHVNGQTGRFNSATQKVETTFDLSKFTAATDLAVMRTLLHESAHAYLVYYFRSDPLNAQKTYPELVKSYAINPDLNTAHHDEFVNTFVQNIAKSLKEYGNSKGYSFSSELEKEQFYQDLAWGGLTNTTAFNGLSISIKDRILDTLAAEQFGVDRLGNFKAQKGALSGC